MDEIIDLAATVEQLKAAGSDASKQLPVLLKLGKFYLRKAKTTANGGDFTKANALFNAALIRSRLLNHKTSEIFQAIVETYRAFLSSLPNGVDEVSSDKIRYEISFHNEILAKDRRTIKERLDEADSWFQATDKTEDDYKARADKINGVFGDIQNMYIRLISTLAEECHRTLGEPRCDYAIIALGSVARMEATPFSDLEFAILYSELAVGDMINYFRVFSHFLHLKVINLGETILPAMGIEELNNFNSSDPNSIWFFDSITPRGISFDGAMPWASKTPLGRAATTDKPGLELIRTPKQMAELQGEEVAVKEGYHLADIMSKAVLLYGNEALLVEYNEHVADILRAKSSSTIGTSTQTVGFTRGIQQMMTDIFDYNPCDSYLGFHSSMGGLFNAKKQFYRLISLLLSDLGMIFDIRAPSPWKTVQKLQERKIIGEVESASIKVCLSIANEIRLKTYYASNKQTELFSPVPQQANLTNEFSDFPIFRDFDEDTLVRLLSVTNDMRDRCLKLCQAFFQQDEIDTSVLSTPFVPSSKATLIGTLYHRLQNLPKALKWMELESKDGPEYARSLHNQGVLFLEMGEYGKSVEFFQNALAVHYNNEEMSFLDELTCLANLATALVRLGQYEEARDQLLGAINRHKEIFGEGSETIVLGCFMHTLGVLDAYCGDFMSAKETFRKLEELYDRIRFVPEMEVLYLQLGISWVLSELNEGEQSQLYLKRAVDLSHKVFGEYSLTSQLAQTYAVVAAVYERCNMNDEALSFFKRSLELFHTIYGNNPYPGYMPFLTSFENLETALEHARMLYDGKPHYILALMLKNLGNALLSEESLEFFQEGKEMMNEILGPNHAHSITSGILNSMGVVYRDVFGDLSKSFECLQGAVNMNSVIYGDDSTSDCTEAVYQNIAITAQEMGNLSDAERFFTKVVIIRRKLPITKETCDSFVAALRHTGTICEIQGKPDEALKFFEEGREVAKVADFKDWNVVFILLALMKKYTKMKSAEAMLKYETCTREAKEMVAILPEDDSLPPKMLERIESLKSS